MKGHLSYIKAATEHQKNREWWNNYIKNLKAGKQPHLSFVDGEISITFLKKAIKTVRAGRIEGLLGPKIITTRVKPKARRKKK